MCIRDSFYGEIEHDGNFIYVNAGHPPPLHFHAGGVTTLKQTGMVLGPSGTSTYSRGFLSMEAGDALLLYTDGMVEATDAKATEFGIDRLRDSFVSMRERTSDEIVRAMIEQVNEFTVTCEPEDDRTVVVVKRTRTPAPLPDDRPPDSVPVG